ncbi:suppressor APC domain-containing protein 2-like isoform X2 [Rana temporaria]|uniref:suppressor APC domain-containing protein 2-like isoform X2 n=1 Tax=Rana temporaria TaxID=8407 RepID=UPI001AACABB8|nr:suppressor APC domain-containing protein 2-like isoform X2 [Rana temporaria]
METLEEMPSLAEERVSSSATLGSPPSVAPTPVSSGLPCPSRGFLRSLRVLYNILEEEGGGQVHVKDIEGLWGGPSILAGVPQALRDATASSGGYLSFPRLVRGLTQALRAADTQEAATPQKKSTKGVTRSQSIHNDVPSSVRLTRQEQRIRRHTLTSGIDYNTLRRMKELEQERDALLDGVQLVDKARDWYRERLHEAEQKRELQCTLDQAPPPPLLGSALLVQIQEVNRFLNDLMSYPEKGHRRQSPYSNKHSDTIASLRYQNQLLTREVTVQNERMWKLQRENEALYRELEERHLHRATFI